jgi:amino acid adenylation domain-containing protein
MSSNPGQLDVLGPAEKRALLAQLLKEKASRPRSFPLSYAQQRLWFLDQMSPGTDAYNIPSAMRLRGTLDVPTLTRSLKEIIRRHEALRTTFEVGEGEPVQVIARAAAFMIPLLELAAEDASEREAEMQRLIREETAQPFDLARGPLLRAKLLRVAADDHVLLLTLHHIICDGWSIGVFMSELAALYEAYASGQQSPLAKLPIQYADYARWQREWLQGEVLEQQLSYWKEQLAGAPAVLELPSDRPRSERTQPGAYSTFRISTETTKGLNELSRSHGATLFMTLLASFQTLLFRYTAQDDIVVGSPIAGRNRAETENLIGFFINTLVMRTNMSGDPSFSELLQRVKETALGAYAHQDVPFERLVEELQPERSLSHSPIFQVMLAVQHARSARLQLPGVSLETMAVGTEAAKFDLMLLLAEDAEGLEARLEYNRDLFEGTTIARLIGHFEVLVESVLRNPEQRLSEFQLLTPAERGQLLVDWNQTATNYSQHRCIHQLFEEQVQRAPENTAVVCGEQRLTYAALNRRANQLAHYLCSVGVGPEVLVGVCMERSIEMMVALLGILKAGGAYLPIDPTYPRARLAFMLEDAAVPVLLTQARLAECIPQTAASILSVDADWEQISQLSVENPGSHVTPENLAYVIYTSGSTGQPKGVEVQHGGLVNLVSWHQREYGVTPVDRATQLSGPSFDASVWEVWPYLAAGASIYIPDPETRVAAAKLVDWITAQSITITFLPTPLAEAVLVTLEEQWPAGCALRNILTGGDQLQRWPRTVLPLSLTNHYGPTENTVVTTSFQVAARVSGEAGPALPPIGRPIANTEVYILDQYQQPVPIGVAGELHIGGDALARGYLKRAELSAERFIPDPFSFTEGARLYRTGDLASYLPDGNIEFRGRIDKQVKVRGFRIELGEIEAALIEHPLVRECVLAAREDEPGEKRLVAYIVGQREQTLPVSELRGYLSEKLPDHMIPAAFVLLDELPLTPNGKIDRRALPAPDNTRPELESSFSAPRTLVEQRLAQIWAEVLHLTEVGIADNFFALGGHSLLVMQVMARVRKAFQIELPLRSLFESPTIERLAQRVETALRLGQNLPAPPIVPVSREQSLPLSFAQQRMWFLAQLEPDVAVYNIPAAVRMTGDLQLDALGRSFSEVVRRHEALRTTFVAHDGIPVQVIHEAEAVAISVLDLSGWEESERESEAQRLIREEARRPFDLARGPLLRVGLLQLGAEEYVLLLTLHHIVSDAWSTEVLVREITTLYQAYVSGEASGLTELAVQYADYAAWQREWLQGEVLEAQLFYWRRQLGELPEVLELPTKGPRPAVQTYRAGGHGVLLSAPQKEAFQALGQAEGTTLFITLLAAFQTLLWHYTRQEQVSVGTPTAGRDRVEIEGLIGCFVNTLVMATDLSGDPTFREVLQRVKEVALGAYAHQDVPFERLVEELQPERSLSHSPLFQVMLVLQNTRDAQLQLAGVTLDTIELESETVKFDLMLTLTEAEPRAEKGLEGRLGYNTDLFEAETIARMVGHFEVLVESVLSNPDQRLSELQLLTAAEREQLLGFNQTEMVYPPGETLAQLFEQQAAQTPEAVALVYEGERVSYGELNRRANQLARHLQGLGVGPEVVVGLCIERAPEMVMGLLGILKAGGAYLPLDPAYPAPRLAFMMADAQAQVLLTQQRLLEGLGEQPAEVLCLDADWESFTRHSDENLEVEVQDASLAYVIYTSGSTGQPKGVMISQQAICNHMRWMQERFPLSAEDAVLQKTPFSFDASVWEFYAPLFAGGRLVLAQPGGQQDSGYLVQTMATEGVTVLQVVPTLLQMLVQEPGLAECTELKRVFCGGEILTRGLAGQLQARLAGVELYNLYGPTEAAIDVTCWPCEREGEWSEWSGVPIGRAIANVQLYVLDQALKLAPVGVSGELYIGGAGLARGYHGRPELTAEKFIPHPYSTEAGARLYRTGDIARYRSDGALEYVGRVDHQVKVRGYRIELGEIEAALLGSAQVREAVVVVHGEGAAQQLVAYVVCVDGPAPASAELKAELQEQLPDYLVPSQYVLLEQLPLTPSGKVDRRALPAPDNTRPELESSFTAPRTLVEQRLAQIWAEVLHLTEVGIADNFFALGGHSLLVMQVMARVRKAFQIELPLRSLFESPTIAGLAQRVETALRLGQNLPAPPIVPVSREHSLPLSFAQQRMWFLAQLEPDVAVYNIPAAVRMSGSLNIAALERSFSEVVRRHEALRTTFVAHDGIPAQVIHEAEAVAIPVLDLSGWQESERESEAQRLIREEARRPFDLARGPLLRVGLLRLGAEEYVLLLTLHHIVSDAWSTEVLVREITTLYQAYVVGDESSLAELAVQYADYAAWQREWLQGDVLEAQLFYWRRQLGELPEVLELPTKGPRPAVQTYRAGGHGLLLSAPQKEAFQALGQAEGTTLFITLLAAFQTLLWHYTRQEQVSVGTPTAGRDRVEIEGLIGCFVNTLVMATDLSGDPTFREVLQRVKEVALGAYAHQDVPFERLVEELQPERSLSHSPLFQVMLVLQNTRNTQLQLPGVSLEPLELDSDIVKFDLMLTLTEAEQGLAGWLRYNTDLFEAETIARMVGHFEVLVESVLRNPEQRLSELQLLSAVEREQLLVEWNHTTAAYPEKSIHELFEEQVQRQPDALAVMYADERISYGELNERANQLAHYLQGLGVGPEVIVGLCVERSVEMVVGLLGILKAGGAYLPLDPSYPRERLAFMLADAEVTVLLTQTHLRDSFAAEVAHFVCLDAAGPLLAGYSLSNPSTTATSDNLAYVIYTSGSTGRPKGVLIRRRALTNLGYGLQEAIYQRVGCDRGLRVSVNAPLVFDASVKQVVQLGWGHTLCVIPDEVRGDGEALLAYLEAGQVEVLDATPAQVHLLLTAAGGAELGTVRAVLVGGEAIDESLWALMSGSTTTQYYNVYGPTECTVDTTTRRVEDRHPSLGQGLGNVDVYLLDQGLKLAPVGMAGELCVGGAGLARGYLQRPELTAEKFIPHPYSTEVGARLYRTGDVARYRSDGALEYVGRVDHQVKVRGYRIELGEVEAALLGSAQVREAVVVVHGEGAAQQLVAYVVCVDGPAPASADLRTQLQEQLPDYMVPNQYVLLERLPLTPSGKVDRRALPAPDNTRPELESSFTAPRTLVEQRLAQIWAEVLHLTEVGVADNFFALGGHSLLVMQVMARVRKSFQIELPLRSLFESPTIAGLAQRVETALRLGQNLPAPPIVPVSREQSLPLSFAQQRMWFLAQMEPDVAVYNIPAAVRMTGDLQLDALGRSFSEVVRRHEALRTTFVAHDGIPVQVIHEAEVVAIPVLDLSGWEETERESEAQRLIREEARRPFDLARGPLLRVSLLQLGAEEYVLLLTLHHIVSDAWSTEVLVREITTLYQAYVSGEASGLTELAVQYADYAAWQREWLQGEVLEAQLFYWRRQLGELPEVLELPTKGPRPAVQTYRAGGQALLLSAPQKEAFQALGQAEGTTLFITLLAAFQTLLWHYTRQEQVSVGTPTAGRDRVEIEGLIGCFVNTLVMATDLSGDPTFREVLQRVKEVALGAYAHQDVPFERLVEELQPERSLSHSPLFQVMLVLQNTRNTQLQLAGVCLDTIELESETVKFDLMLTLTEAEPRAEKGLEGRLGYNTDLFEAETIARMVGHFEVLVESVLSNPDQRLSELQLLTAAEREQLLGFNQTEMVYPPGETLAQLFEQQAAQTPEAVALVYEGERVSYGELNRRANQLARHLQGLGVGPEVVVGLCIERSPEMVMGLLGILKAGGAYLPLDPAYPAPRLAFMMADAQAQVLLTQQRLLEGLGEQAAEVLCLDADWESFTRHGDENLEVEVQSANLAYVIYTSGSTGQPKGVMISQQAICNHMRWMQERFPLSAEDAVLQKTPFSFDASVWEFYAPLFAGGRLVLAQPGGQQDSGYLVQTMATEGVTVLQVVPTLLQMLVQEPGLSECRQLKLVFCGGEILTRGLAGQLQARLSEVELYNLYGPTEAAIDVTCWPCERETEDEWSEWSGVPIGRAIANVQLYVLDQALKLAPVGVSGELYIGGAGLARGYHGRPELTAERFVPHPYSTEAGARLYRTGDVARYRSDGTLEYVGRVDHQVKVRGYRIELGEVEAALLGSAQVREAAVVVHGDGAAQQLVAYVVCVDGPAPASADLRTQLQEQLPDYMVPSQYVLLERLPLTPSGKVDRRALPAPDNTRPELESSFSAPRTLVEQRLAQIWAEVLHLTEVGIADNFFALGGHSLLVMQVMARVRKSFQIELPLRSLFESPTIAGLAQRVETALRLGQNLPAPPIVPVSREHSLPLSFAQQRMWFLAQLEPDVAVYNIPAAVRMSGSLNIAALERSFSEVVRRHEALRTTFVAHDGIPAQVIHEAEAVAISVLDLSGWQETERESEAQRLIREEARRPFDLARGPLLRVSLLQLGAEEYVLLLTLHHIVSDAWSTEVLVREITTLYQAYVSGEASGLTELAVQYADYAAWQREWLQGEVLEAQLFYWRRQLGELPEVLELPTKGPRPAVQTYRAGGHGLLLSAPQKEAFQVLGQAEGTTLFITLLAAFQTLLWHYTRQEQVSVGTPTAGRDRVEIEGLIGCFVNTLVMATDLSGDPTFREVLQRVKEVALGAYAHQDVPFERLVEELSPARDLSWTPLFQVMFMLGTAREEREAIQLPGVSLSLIRGSSGGGAKFDLLMWLDQNTEGELKGALIYNADLFAESMMSRMSEHFRILVDAVIAKPDVRLSELQLLNATEREQVQVEWNDTKRDYPRENCIHELFEKQVERTPNTVAVVYGKEQISYRELNERANQLAQHLRKLGVRAEVLVGICMERSVELVVGLLGILKAGGAYVPIDPVYPKERLASLLQDARVSILLTEQPLLARLPLQEISVVCLDSDRDVISTCDRENLPGLSTPQTLAYMIYTSGSTGEPKGVLTQHNSLVNYIDAARVEFGLGPDDRVLQFAPVSFDTASEEIYTCLTSGATLVLRDELMVSSVPAFLQSCRDLEITVLDLPSAYWHHLTAALLEHRLTLPESLRLVILGGEKALPERLAIWHRLVDHRVRLLNTYGPTEATIVSTKCDVSAPSEKPETWREVPIGRPVPNAQVYLLDRNLKPVPIGVSGDLYIGGEGLARGYFQRPDATAEKFVPDRFSAAPGARLYRSGDLARYLDDGRIEFLGRNDHQVKVRGFRIEVGEIEAILLQQPQVRDAIVIAREDVPGDRRLVAYVVAGQEPEPSVSELRKALQEKLPEYMMPAAFVLLDKLPLTSNGKIDRRALPTPEHGRSRNGNSHVAPRTPTEQRLAAIWAEVLKHERVGIHDNFFELGGHSLLATQMVLRVRDAFQIELPLRRLFESATVAGLAQEVDKTLDSGVVFKKQVIAPLPRDPYRTKRSSLQRRVQTTSQLSDDEEVFVFPASFAQQRLWFLDQLKPDSTVYNISDAVRLSGPLDTDAFERTINEITRRHEALRTTFAIVDEQPVQVISPARFTSLLVRDISDQPDAERETEALRLITEEAQRPFNLSQGPLLRVSLLKLGDAEHVLLMTMHHIVSDGWSIGVLTTEMKKLYAAFSAGQKSPLPELPIQYADFAQAQREWLSGEVLDEQVAYWKQQLSGIPAVLELPIDHPRPPIQTFRGATQSLMLSRTLSEELNGLSIKEGVTLFMTMLAAFQTLLYRYTGQDEIAVGTPIAGRTSAETERLIGFFINVLVLSTRMQGDLSFRRLMSQVKETALGGYAHQDVPFEKLVEELQLRRDISRSPLFQVMMMLQNASPGPGRLADDLKMNSIGAKGAISKFELTLSLAETAEGLKAVVEYNTDLFEAATIQRLLRHFEVMLEGIVADPDQQLSQLPLLTAPERQQLLLDWNQTGAGYPRHQCIQHLVEEQAERTPDATAVVCGERRLSYAELNRRANQLAHYLRNQAVGPEVLVGVCMERSIEMVVALLGILKAGGAYLPLDPSYPQARLSFMLEDAAVPVLLTQARLTESLPHTAASVMRVDADWLRVSDLSVENPVIDVTPDNLAYMIYTSGSAGQPKGVEVQHGSLINLVTWHQREYNVTSLDRATQLAGPSFDASVWELWPYLAAGASIHIPDQETRVAAAKLMDWMAAESITITFLPTPLAEAALATLEEHWPAGFTLKHLLTGGDQLQRWPRTPLPLSLINHYGPTENTVVTTSCPVGVRASVADGPVSPPIGRPIANTEVYILDQHQEPVPIGIAGELHIGGASLARGYLRRPELTAERFIPNPFGPDPGARLYKTGDLARYLPDGNIEFRGRIDNQVKVRGFRIELGEIETVFAEHPSVRECVVVARDDERGEKRLVAYLVSEPVGVSELRSHLNAKLPDYMVPAAFVMLDQLPLTPNGKIDRRALQALVETSLNQHEAYVAPRDNVELQLVQMWEDLLGTNPIGVTDNFFELGGHSLTVVNLMNRIEDRFQRQLPLATLFQRGTIEQLAEVLRQQQGTIPQSSLVEIRSGSAKPLFCVHAVGGTVLGYHKLAHLLSPDQAVYGLQARGLYGEDEPHTRIEDMAADYIEALRVVQPQGPYLLAGHSMGGVIAFEMSRQLQHLGEEVALLALMDSWAPVYIPEQDDATLLVQFAQEHALPIIADDLLQRPPDEQLTYLVEQAQLAHVLPPGVGIEQARRLLHVYKNNVRAIRSYLPQLNPCRITLFRSSEHLTETRDPASGWASLTVAEMEIYDVPGNHFSMNREPHVRILAERLQNCINQTSTE